MVKPAAAEHDEEAFPRGRQGQHSAPDAPGDVTGHPKQPSSSSRAAKGRKEVDDNDADLGVTAAGVALPSSVNIVRPLRPSSLVEGTLLVAAIREVTEEELVLDLPFQMVGFASTSHATEPGVVPGEGPKLVDAYSRGQLVTVVILAILEVGQQKKTRIEVSLRPSLVNAGVDVSGIVPHMCLTAVVQSEEEHVFRLGFGVEGLQGLLKKSEATGLLRPLCPGAVLQVRAHSINKASMVVRCSTSSAQPLGSDPVQLQLVKPGFLVYAKVEKVLDKPGNGEDLSEHANGGLVTTFCGVLTGLIHWQHQPHAAEQAVRRGARVAARVLAVVPGTPSMIHLTLLPHLVDWSPQLDHFDSVAVGDRLQGEVVATVPRLGCRLRCVRDAEAQAETQAEAPALEAFCHLSRLADPEGDKDERAERALPAVGGSLACRVLGFNMLEALLTVTCRPRDLREGALVAPGQLAPGQLVVGSITRLVDFGVFVELSDYVTGLVHLRHLTDVPLAQVPQRFQEGAKIKCRVLKVHKERGRVSLTAKKSLVRSDFQLSDTSQARKDMLVTGFVTRVKPEGAYVAFYGDVYGLIPAEEMERAEAPAAGMAVRCRIVRVKPQLRKLVLSLDLADGREPVDFQGSAPGLAGEGHNPRRGGVVTDIAAVQCTEDAVIVRFRWRTNSSESTLPDNTEVGMILLPHLADEISLAKAWHAAIATQLGGAVTRTEVLERAAILSSATTVSLQNDGVVLLNHYKLEKAASAEEARTLPSFSLLSLKPSLVLAAAEGAFASEFADLQESRLYTGYVREVHPFGAFVSVGSWRLTGFAPRHQIAEHFVAEPNQELLVGQTVRVRVSKLDPDRNKFMVDLRAEPASAADVPILRREAEALRLLFKARADLGTEMSRSSPHTGMVLDATVTAIKDFGVLVALKDYEGLTAVALKENVPKETKTKVGESVRCVVLDFDAATNIADISLEPALLSISSGPLGVVADEGARPAGKKRRNKGNPAEIGYVPLVKSTEVMAELALQKPAYSVLWSKSPPAIFFMPPFGERSWSSSRAVVIHSVPAAGEARGRVVAQCPTTGESRVKGRVPRILRPAEELQLGAPLTMRVQSVQGVQLVCSAPVGLRGYVHATHLADPAELGGPPVTPLATFSKRAVVEGRVLHLEQRSGGKDEKTRIWHVELTCRPALLEPRDTSEYEAARLRWSAVRPGRQLPAVVSDVKRDAVWLELATGIIGRVLPLDATRDIGVARALPDHFQRGQVFKVLVLSVNKSQRMLDLALQDPQPAKAGKCHTLARVTKVELGARGIAASFRLPGNRVGVCHITELFDFWAEFPLQRLKQGHLCEAVELDPAEEAAPGERVEVSLRASQVFGRAEGPEERRPLSAEDLRVGQAVSGYVVGASPKGVFVALSRRLVARIQLRALSDHVVPADAVARLHPPGQLVRGAQVVSIKDGQVELSLRSGKGAADALTLDQFSVGDVVSGRVKAVEKYGLFVRIDNSSIDALIHRSEISDTASVSLDSYKKGQRIKHAKVLKIENGKIRLGLKATLFVEGELDDDEEDPDLELEEDDAPEEGAQTATADATAEEARTEEPPTKKSRTTKDQVQTAVFETAPWEQSFFTAAPVPDAATAFEFAEFRVVSPSGSEDEREAVEDSDNDEVAKRPSKRQKKNIKAAEAKELQKQEAENAEGLWATDPQSVEDFERLLLTQGDTSIVWIRYMAFHLKMSDLERARQVAERAVKHVGFSEAKERFNVWVAYMNLECTFGTDEKAEAIFRRAASHNDAKQVHLQLARIHARNKKPQRAVGAYEACCRKFAQSKKVWLALMTFLYEQKDFEGARKTLPKSLAALPRRKHPVVVSKAAVLEYQHGSPERGRSIFEGLLDSYPKRTDLWSVYIDAHIKAYTPPKVASPDFAEIRSLLERCCTMKLKVVKMRFFFKKWLDFEKRWGDAESQERVRTKARLFVESQGS